MWEHKGGAKLYYYYFISVFDSEFGVFLLNQFNRWNVTLNCSGIIISIFNIQTVFLKIIIIIDTRKYFI